MRALDIDGPAGRLEAILMTPEGPPRAAAVLCHAHPLQGGTMHFKLLFHVAKALREEGFAVLRFQFRGVGRSEGVYDNGRGERDDAVAALSRLAVELPDVPLALGGFSFGAWVSLRVAARDERVRALVLMGLPVRVVPGLDRVRPRATAGALFVQGERDEFGDAAEIRGFVASFPEPRELVIVPGADHLFTDRVDEAAGAVSDWARRLPTL